MIYFDLLVGMDADDLAAWAGGAEPKIEEVDYSGFIYFFVLLDFSLQSYSFHISADLALVILVNLSSKNFINFLSFNLFCGDVSLLSAKIVLEKTLILMKFLLQRVLLML